MAPTPENPNQNMAPNETGPLSCPETRLMPELKKTHLWGEDIVISGIAGRFPEADNIEEFKNNLYEHIDMITKDDRRWPSDLHDGLGTAGGRLKSLVKFDNEFFNLMAMVSDHMDPASRILLETTYESIIDAGVNPQTLRGTKTGVYLGVNSVANASGLPQDDFADVRRLEAGLWVQGSSKSLFASFLSFSYDLIGPTVLVDTACSSTLAALAYAVNDLRSGNCETALVTAVNLCQEPFVNQLYQSIGLMASDGKCKVWDKNADGFVRSETIGTMILQKKSVARRNYCTVLHSKTNTDGFKNVGVFSPYWYRQRDLMIETYQEAGINPHIVKFFESHGTGTNVGDPQEAKAIAAAYCSDDRPDPLMIGAVKSNMGHSEGASGLNSVLKVILTFENKSIPANLHLKEIKPEIPSMVDGTIVAVMENTPFEGGIVGVNSFGVGGINANALLKSNNKEFTADSFSICTPIPRLVNVCGRTKEAANHVFDFIQNNPNKISRDFLALLGEPMKTVPIRGSIHTFPFRGHMIIKENGIGDDGKPQYTYQREVNDASKNTGVWLMFSGMGSQWTAMAKTLMPIDCFSKSIARAANVLKPYNVDLMNLLLNDDETLIKKDIIGQFVVIAAMQAALYDLIKELNINVEGIVGHSFGEVGCAYADGCLTLEQSVLASYWRGKIVESTKLPKGMLAAVGCSWEDAVKMCPPGIVAACHNGSDSVTISGLYNDMSKFVEKLKSENIFVRPVSGGDFPYHSPFMKPIEEKLLEALNTVIPHPKQRSEKWYSSSYPESQWTEPNAQLASGHYFVHNALSPVLFDEAMAKVPKDSVVIEVAPHSLFETIFKRCFPKLNYIGLMKRNDKDNLDFLLNAIGKIYAQGLNPNIENLYPKIHWPVSRGTQSIGALMKWNHVHDAYVKTYPEFFNFSTASDYSMKFTLKDIDWRFLKDHCIDGHVLFPATGYLMMVWRRLANMRAQPWNKTPVAFENIRFWRATLMTETNEVKFVTRIMEGTGEFGVYEGKSIVVTGRVWVPEENECLELQDKLTERDDDDEEEHDTLTQKEIYKEMRIRGYDYGPEFQGLIEARDDGKVGKCKWTDQWITFLDSILHIGIIAMPLRVLLAPIGIQSIRIDPNVLNEAIELYTQDQDQEPKVNKDFDIEAETIEKANLPVFGEGRFVYTAEEEEESRELVKSSVMTKKEKMAANILGLKSYRPEDEESESGEGNEPIFTVKFDLDLNIVVTKGVEVKGLIPINIPRRTDTTGLLIENYKFLLHNEESAIDEREKKSIAEYVSVCNTLIKNLSDANGNKSKLIMNDYKEANEEIVKKYLHNPKDDQILLKLLKEIIGFKYDENSNVITDNGSNNGPNNLNELIKAAFAKPEYDLSKDVLNMGWSNERLIRPFIDIVLENRVDRSIKVLEMNSGNGIAALNLVKLITTSVLGLVNINYNVAVSSPNNIPPELKPEDIRVMEWDNENKFLDDINEIDLLIYKASDEIIKKGNIDKHVESLLNSVNEYGFVILAYRNRLAPPECNIYEMGLKMHQNDNTFNENYVNSFIVAAEKNNLKLIGRKSDSLSSNVILFRKIKTEPFENPPKVINVLKLQYDHWFETLKDEFLQLKDDSENDTRIWLIANDSTYNGAIGLTKCLRLEPGGQRVRCIFDPQQRLPKHVDFTKSPYKELQTLDLSLNVYQNGQWGTYRHVSLPTDDNEIVQTEHAYLNQMQRGDMSSFMWVDAPQKYWKDLSEKEKGDDAVLCNIYYSALNFKDVVFATGRVHPGPQMALFDCIIGMEFSGRRSDTGERVMGMVPFRGIATSVMTNKKFLWKVPDNWTLEEAATVPIAYVTAYYSLFMRGQMKKGEKVLIHSGAGAVGQAAIIICQSMDCEIFATVGTVEKREYLKQKYNIPDDHIGNSHEISFERLIQKMTKGKGVDIVLNSLAEDKLQASVRCLGINGRFLEIGKYDMQMNKNLGLFVFLKNISFHGICMDVLMNDGQKSTSIDQFWKEITEILHDGINSGVVKPLDVNLYQKNQSEEAFRYMMTGKHIGKVLIQIRDEEKGQQFVKNSLPVVVSACTRTMFHPSKIYVIVGGLGGCGMELAHWMMFRGAKKVVLTSRYGIRNAFQKLYLKRFKEYTKYVDVFKTDFIISSINANTMEGADELIDEANKHGPIGGIFNLALVLNDALIENQTIDTFTEVCEPKADATINLDIVSRKKCPQLDYFVVFSTLTSGRGNQGQSNYGYANSVMERVCEERKQSGLPALAIQWGPIGDVGIVAEQFIEAEQKAEALKFSGIMLQRLPSILEVLDRMMQSPYTIVSSIVKASLEQQEKKSEDEFIHHLCNSLNIDKRDDNETLGEIGIDSLVAVEIQQGLERGYGINLTINDIRKITVKDLKDFRDGNRDSLRQYANDIKRMRVEMGKVRFDIPTDQLRYLNDVKTGKPVFFLPPIEGLFNHLEPLAALIKRPVIAVNWTKQMRELNYSDIKTSAAYYANLLKDLAPEGNYDIVGHSFGGVLATQMFKKNAPISNLILLDPTPFEIKDEITDDEKMKIIFNYLRSIISSPRIIQQLEKDVTEVEGEEARIAKVVELLRQHGGRNLHGKDVEEVFRGSFRRAEMIVEFRKKMLAKIEDTAKSSYQKKMIQKKVKTNTAQVTIVKLVYDKAELKEVEDKFVREFGIKKENVEKSFEIYMIKGDESDFLSKEKGNVQFIGDLINRKL